MTEWHQARMWDEIRDLLFEWDPLGIAHARSYAEDEYDCVMGPLVGLLRRDPAEEEIVSFLNEMLDDHFGLNSWTGDLPEVTKTFAASAKGWYRKWGKQP